MTADEARRVVEVAHQLDQLVRRPEWRYLVEFAADQVNAKRRAILSGAAKSFEEYRRETGWIEGASFVLEAAELAEAAAKRARPLLNKGE